MKNRLAAILIGAAAALALASCGGPAGARADRPVKQDEVPLGRLPDGVTPTVYRLALTVDPAADGFTGHVEIDVTLDRPHARIWLHAQDQTIVRAVARVPNGTEIPATFTGNQDPFGVARLDFDVPLPAGQVTLVIDYEAPYNFGLAGLYKVSSAGEPYIASQMQPIDARRMVPSFDEPRFKTVWAITVRAPAGQKVIGNGTLISSTPVDGGMIEHLLSPTRPLPTYLLALAVGPYDESELRAIAITSGLRPANVPLRGFAAKGKGAKLKAALDITEAMLLSQEKYFAQAYPYGKLDLIAVPDFAYGAMENAGAIVYREAALLIDERTSLERRRAIFTTHAHELAHQWFGNYVTPKWWDDIWLNEAFATWMSFKTMADVDPAGEWALNPINGGLNAMAVDSLASSRQIRNPVATNAEIQDGFDAITYQKGGSVLNMFETYLGEDPFREGIRFHMRRFPDGVATADDFMMSLAEGSGDKGVTDSFRTFIEQPGIPLLDVTVSCAPAGARLQVKQSRYAPLGSKIDQTGTRWQVPFSVRTNAETRKMMLTQPASEIPLSSCPAYVMPNAGGTGYWRFALDPASAAALAENYANLSAGEQMVYLDSLMAGFAAGRVDADTLLAGLEASVGGSPAAVALPFAALRSWHARLDEAGRKAMSAWIERTYAPLERRLAARPDSALTAREKLLEEALTGLLVDIGNRPAARAALARRAEAYVGFGRASANPRALAPEEVGPAFAVAAADRGWAFIEPALAFARASDNQTERALILSTLAARADARVASELVGGMQNLGISGSESYSLLMAAASNVAAQEAVWTTFTENFDKIIAQLPEIRKAQTASMAGNFCTTEGAARAKAFFDSKAAALPGYERSLAQGLERAELCAAQSAELVPKLSAALAAR